MRTFAIINQKGGCGKTTTSINLSACLARLGHRTLLVDMDPQGHCAVGLAVPEEQIERTVFDCLIEERDGRPARLAEVVWQIATDFDLAPSNIKLAGFEQVFSGRTGREDRLARALQPVRDTYQWCVVDCPPGVGLLTFNALRAADEVVVPVETGYFSLHGLAKMMETLELLRDRCHKDIKIRILPTLYDTRTKLAREVLAELRTRFRDYLMESTVNFNTKLKEAASFGQPITEYDPGSRGYKDFINLARELMGHRPVEPESAALAASAEPMSRPAELAQRAKQLAHLSGMQFGRSATVPTPAVAALPPNMPMPSPVSSPPPAPRPVVQPSPVSAAINVNSTNHSPEGQRAPIPNLTAIPFVEPTFTAPTLTTPSFASAHPAPTVAVNRAALDLSDRAAPPMPIYSGSPGLAALAVPVKQVKMAQSNRPNPRVISVTQADAAPSAVALLPSRDSAADVRRSAMPTVPAATPATFMVDTAALRLEAAMDQFAGITVEDFPASPFPSPTPSTQSQPWNFRSGGLDAGSGDGESKGYSIGSFGSFDNPARSNGHAAGIRRQDGNTIFSVQFSNARSVVLAGDFNDWSPSSTPLRREQPGWWRVALCLRPGRYRYRYVVDGRWVTDPTNPIVEANEFGELNNIVEAA